MFNKILDYQLTPLLN